MHWFMASSHELIRLVSEHNYLALFVLILIEEAGCPLPLPGESLLLYAGARILRGQMSVWRVYAAVMPASAIGCTILYYLARTGGRALVSRLGRRVHFSERQLDAMEAKAARVGPVAVLIGRLTPGIRVPTDVAAGILRIPFRFYLPFALRATALRLAFFLYLGARVQQIREAIVLARDARWILSAVVLLAMACAAWFTWKRLSPRLRREGAPAAVPLDGPLPSI